MGIFLNIFTRNNLLQTSIFYNVLRHHPKGDTNPLIFARTNLRETLVPYYLQAPT